MFTYQQDALWVESVPVVDIIQSIGTPCYIYTQAGMAQAWQSFSRAARALPLPVDIHYAVKANSNLAVLHLLREWGAGFDVVSVGELRRVQAAGGTASHCVFSGVGKSEEELVFALEAGIQCINIESEPELRRVHTVAQQLGKVAPIALRINPDVDAKTHPYIATGLSSSKFGIPITQALDLYQHARTLSGVQIRGVDCHIGSQITQLTPFIQAFNSVLRLIDTLCENGITVDHINLGGGLGVRYRDEVPPSADDYMQAIMPLVMQAKEKGVNALYFEPGRALVAAAGILVTQVEYVKQQGEKSFIVVDAGMNDFMRPALYDAWQDIIPVVRQNTAGISVGTEGGVVADVVGPVCETADFLGKDRVLSVREKEWLAVTLCGAYGFVMSSNYNTRPRPAEVLVRGHDFHCVRERETIDDLLKKEHIPV